MAELDLALRQTLTTIVGNVSHLNFITLHDTFCLHKPNVKITKEVATSHVKQESCKSVPEQPEFEGETKHPSTSQAKRKKRKTKNKKKKTSLSTSTASLSTCPTDVLNIIIGFLRVPNAATCNPDLLNLRLVNRGFRYLLQPVVYNSIRIPRKDCVKTTVTHDVRELLRLIAVNPSLATCIKHLNYDETLNHDFKPFQYSIKELQNDQNLLKVYEHMCTPLLLSRLTNLNLLVFRGYIGGRYSYIFTEWAHHIWTRMPLRSVKRLVWQSIKRDYDRHRIYRLENDEYYYKSAKNDWNIFCFLRFTPGLKYLIMLSDMFLARATPEILPVLHSLKTISIQIRYGKETSQCILQLLQCCPKLKNLTAFESDLLNASIMRKALRLVRKTIEEIDINVECEGISCTDGGIGPFNDFPQLRHISTTLGSLVPLSSMDWPDDFSLLRLLPANLESLEFYHRDPHNMLLGSRQNNKNEEFQYNLFSEIIRRPYGWLEDVALAKESGALRNLCRISIDDECWRLISNEIIDKVSERLAAICTRLEIDWEGSGAYTTSSWEKQSEPGSDWGTDSD
ncbi:hypothetical protein BZA77DRAFT_291883 [Pyronema omphalodes]|nr:hypothetical protein BZA77DRAFT_375416 [Pyronema omphalodes]KAI5817954.1 hypothetical protein BZA77DRAFT_291883 [Pyronema omphalodes]